MKTFKIQRLINLCCTIASFLFLVINATGASANAYDNNNYGSKSFSLKELSMQPEAILEEIENQNNSNCKEKSEIWETRHFSSSSNIMNQIWELQKEVIKLELEKSIENKDIEIAD